MDILTWETKYRDSFLQHQVDIRGTESFVSVIIILLTETRKLLPTGCTFLDQFKDVILR